MILNKQKIRMMEGFTKDENLEVTASQISREKGLNQKSVYIFLEDLEKRGILKSKFQGRNKLYSLNKENKGEIKNFLLLVEHFKTLLFYQKNPKLKIILDKIIFHMKGIIAIFGSYAKGTEKEDSDLDVFILGKCNKKKIQEIAEVFNIDINVKLQSSFKENPVTREIKKNHILIKNFEQYLEEAYSWTN